MARRVVHGTIYAHLAPPTYTEVMREAGDNDLIVEPTQPAAEHTASEAVVKHYVVECSIGTLWETVEADDEESAIGAALDAWEYNAADIFNGGTWSVRETEDTE